MTTAENLLKGDVWSDDGGETWWEVIANDHEAMGVRRIFSRCVASRRLTAPEGMHESAVLDCTHEVRTRREIAKELFWTVVPSLQEWHTTVVPLVQEWEARVEKSVFSRTEDIESALGRTLLKILGAEERHLASMKRRRDAKVQETK